MSIDKEIGSSQIVHMDLKFIEHLYIYSFEIRMHGTYNLSALVIYKQKNGKTALSLMEGLS